MINETTRNTSEENCQKALTTVKDPAHAEHEQPNGGSEVNSKLEGSSQVSTMPKEDRKRMDEQEVLALVLDMKLDCSCKENRAGDERKPAKLTAEFPQKNRDMGEKVMPDRALWMLSDDVWMKLRYGIQTVIWSDQSGSVW